MNTNYSKSPRFNPSQYLFNTFSSLSHPSSFESTQDMDLSEDLATPHVTQAIPLSSSSVPERTFIEPKLLGYRIVTVGSNGPSIKLTPIPQLNLCKRSEFFHGLLSQGTDASKEEILLKEINSEDDRAITAQLIKMSARSRLESAITSDQPLNITSFAMGVRYHQAAVYLRMQNYIQQAKTFCLRELLSSADDEIFPEKFRYCAEELLPHSKEDLELFFASANEKFVKKIERTPRFYLSDDINFIIDFMEKNRDYHPVTRYALGFNSINAKENCLFFSKNFSLLCPNLEDLSIYEYDGAGDLNKAISNFLEDRTFKEKIFPQIKNLYICAYMPNGWEDVIITHCKSLESIGVELGNGLSALNESVVQKLLEWKKKLTIHE